MPVWLVTCDVGIIRTVSTVVTTAGRIGGWGGAIVSPTVREVCGRRRWGAHLTGHHYGLSQCPGGCGVGGDEHDVRGKELLQTRPLHAHLAATLVQNCHLLKWKRRMKQIQKQMKKILKTGQVENRSTELLVIKREETTPISFLIWTDCYAETFCSFKRINEFFIEKKGEHEWSVWQSKHN